MRENDNRSLIFLAVAIVVAVLFGGYMLTHQRTDPSAAPSAGRP